MHCKALRLQRSSASSEMVATNTEVHHSRIKYLMAANHFQIVIQFGVDEELLKCPRGQPVVVRSRGQPHARSRLLAPSAPQRSLCPAKGFLKFEQINGYLDHPR